MRPMRSRWQCKTIEGLMLLPSRVILVEFGGAPVIKTALGYQFDGEYYLTLWDLPAGRYRLIGGPPVPWHLYWRWRLKDRLSWQRMVFRMVFREGARYHAASGF